MLDIVLYVPLYQQAGSGDAGFVALLEEAVKQIGDLPFNVYKVTDDKFKASKRGDLYYYQDFSKLGITPDLLFIGPTISKLYKSTDKLLPVDKRKTKVAIIGEYNLTQHIISRYKAEVEYFRSKGYRVQMLQTGLGKHTMGIFANPKLLAPDLSFSSKLIHSIPEHSKVWVEYHSCSINDRLFLLLKGYCNATEEPGHQTIVLLGSHGFSHSRMERFFSTSRQGFVKAQAEKLNRMFGEIHYVDHDNPDRSFTTSGRGKGELLILAKNSIPHNDYLYLLKEQSDFVIGVTGDQSFGEALMLGKLPLYEDHIVWKESLITEYRRYIYKAAKQAFGQGSRECKFLEDWFRCCFPSPLSHTIRSTKKMIELGEELKSLEETLKPFFASTCQQLLEENDLSSAVQTFVEQNFKTEIAAMKSEKTIPSDDDGSHLTIK